MSYLQLDPHLVHLADLGRIEAGDHHALVGDGAEEALLLEGAHRLADRRAGDAVHGRQLPLQQPLAGKEAVAQNILPQRVLDELAQGAIGKAGIAGRPFHLFVECIQSSTQNAREEMRAW